MAILNIPTGINSFGNFTDTAIPLADISNNVKTVKTMVDGHWQTWTAGTPIDYQGVTNIESGKGFVVRATAAVDLVVSDTNVDINDVAISGGLNFLCFPYNNKQIIKGILPRTKSISIKTLLGTWKSWTDGIPDANQGFNVINKNNGYICNVDSVFDNYIDNNKRDLATGVRIGTEYTNDTSNLVVSSVVEFAQDQVFGDISHDPVVIADPLLPLKDMWVKINNTVKLIRYPIELEGKRFSIKELKLEAINNGGITELNTLIKDNGNITDTNVVIEDLGDLTGGFKFSDTVHSGVFAYNINNTESNPAVIDDKIVLSNMEMMYDIKPTSPTTVYHKMYLSINGVKTVVEFADEYTGDGFVLVKDKVIYNSNFVASETFKVL